MYFLYFFCTFYLLIYLFMICMTEGDRVGEGTGCGNVERGGGGMGERERERERE